MHMQSSRCEFRVSSIKGDERRLTERWIKTESCTTFFITPKIRIVADLPNHLSRVIAVFYCWRIAHIHIFMRYHLHSVKFIAVAVVTVLVVMVVLYFCYWTGFSVFYERQFLVILAHLNPFYFTWFLRCACVKKYAYGDALSHTHRCVFNNNNITRIIEHISHIHTQGVLIYGWRFRLWYSHLQHFCSVPILHQFVFAFKKFAIAYFAYGGVCWIGNALPPPPHGSRRATMSSLKNCYNRNEICFVFLGFSDMQQKQRVP